jgi:GNAT superfamily N-acetyltransferase
VPLAPTTRGRLRRYWADRFGIDPDALEESGVVVGSADEGGVQLFSRGDGLLIGAPEPIVGSLRCRGDSLADLDPTDPEAVRGWFSRLGDVETVLGPAFYGYTDGGSFRPVESRVEPLAHGDERAYDRFRRSVPVEEWENGGPTFEPERTVGLFEGREIVAAAGYDVWDDALAHLAVVVSRGHRGQGHGRAVVSRATELALDDGLVPQYRTLDAWSWSVALARGLGFERFATGTFVAIETTR